MSRFPKISETFILYEILEQERLGIAGEVYPLLRERQPVAHPEAKIMINRAHFHPFISWPIIRANWHFIRNRPHAYFKVLAEILRETFGSANFFFGALGIFPKTVCFAYEMASQGVTHIHAHFANHPAVAALIIHQLTDIPFSFTARGSDVHVDRRMLDRKIAASAFAITVSSYNKELMINECSPSVYNKIHVIYGGIDTEVFSPRPKSDSNGPFQILCVSSFEEVKGHIYLIEACRLLRERGVDFECHLVGDGPLRRKIEKQIARAGLKDRVWLYGACTQAKVIEKLSRADVAVLATAPTPSGKCEGIPNVLKEAMACGLPVVASSISGIPELVDDGRSGFLVPPKNVTTIADALQRLKDDPVLRQQMGQAGREKVIREFNLHISAAKRAKLFLTGKSCESTTPS
jgi:Glycosyltransferase